MASRPGAQGRLRAEHRKRRRRTLLRAGWAVTVGNEVSVERESNCPPAGKLCPRTRIFWCPLSPTDPSVADEMAAKIEQLLDENLVSAASQRELDALRYAIAIARRY